MNIEGITALESNPFVNNGSEQTEETQSTETVTNTEEVGSTETKEEETVSTPPNEIELEGLGKVKIDDIKEWQKGYLRQSDYTRKTQDIAKQKAEVQDALEVFNYLKTNPHLVESLKQLDQQGTVNTNIINKATPENSLLQDVWYNQKSMELDATVARLKQQYGEIDEVKLYNTATELGTNNLEFVYKAIAFENNKVNEQALLEKAKAELKAELEKNRNATSTIVNTNQTQIPTNKVVITDAERRVAEGMGISAEDYAKWRDK